jgi:hypothetical protein
MRKLACLVILFSSASVFAQKFEGQALTPPMGWNSWNKFACDVDEKLIRETAGATVSSGMKVGRGFLESRAGSERRRFCMEGARTTSPRSK